MDERKSELVAKVPQITFLFWVVKILATTLGETGGDAVTMSWLGETTIRCLPGFVSAPARSRSSFSFKNAVHSQLFRRFSRVARP